MKPYLFLFNLGSCVGWAFVLYIATHSAWHGHTAAQLWERLEHPLLIVQSMAALEVVHSLLGIVRSPFFTALVQVASRLILVWGYSHPCPLSHTHWSLYLMVVSWSLVEVPRYLFYALNLYMARMPYPLFWLRYSLFAILYPTGMLGELSQVWVSLPFWLQARSLIWWYASLALMASYIPGGPFMYVHMLIQRKRAIKNRLAASAPPTPRVETGLLFPVDKKGDRSTSEAGKAVFAASLDAVDAQAAARVRTERNWRFGYPRHVVRNVELAAQSPENALTIARAGLDWLHHHFEFLRDGQTMSLAEAMNKVKGSFADTGFIKGSGKREGSFRVEYKGTLLTGDALVQQLQKWAEYGTIEPEARDALITVAERGDWCDLSDRWFVLLGAGSAMGPLEVLLSCGANVVAIDLDRPAIWKRLLGTVRNSCGTMTFPLKKKWNAVKDDEDKICEAAGCNLFTETPEICNCMLHVMGLLRVAPDKELIVGGYAYLDSAAHVQVSLAMDAIMAGVCAQRKGTTLAFLCSPSDVFVIPEASRKAAQENARNAPFWQKLVSLLSRGRFLAPNVRVPVTASDGKTYDICDGLAVAQGPNYALAKRIQHWRAMIARTDGFAVSSNIAPSTSTVSVVHNKQFAAAYGGFHNFRPLEVLGQETSNAVMAGLLIYDIRARGGVAQPKTSLANPLLLFASGAFHGGVWRSAFKMNSIGEVAVLAFYTKVYAPMIAIGMSLGAVCVSLLATGRVSLPHTWTFFH